MIQADISRIKDELLRTGTAMKNGDVRSYYPLLVAGGSAGENPTSSVASIPWMQDIKKKIVETESNLDRLSPEYAQTNPEIVGLRAQLGSLQDNLDKELSRVLITYIEYYRGYLQYLDTQRKSNDLERNRNETELAKISDKIDKAAARNIEFGMLMKNYEALQDVYNIFLHKQNELVLLREQGANLPHLRVFEPACLPCRQVSPNLPLNAGLGIFFGLLVAIAGCLSQEKKQSSEGSNSGAVERRKMSRINKDYVVAYGLKDENGTEVRRYASTGNISGSGLSLILKEYLPEDTRMDLEIQVTDKDFITAAGAVSWIKPIDGKKGMFSAGVHLVSIAPQEREKLINLLYGESYYAAR